MQPLVQPLGWPNFQRKRQRQHRLKASARTERRSIPQGLRNGPLTVPNHRVLRDRSEVHGFFLFGELTTLLAFQLAYGFIRLVFPLILKPLVEHQRQDVVFPAQRFCRVICFRLPKGALAIVAV